MYLRLWELNKLFCGCRYLGQCSDEPYRDTHPVVLLADPLVLNPDAHNVGVDNWFAAELELGLVLEVIVNITLSFEIELRGELEDEAELGKHGLQP